MTLPTRPMMIAASARSWQATGEPGRPIRAATPDALELGPAIDEFLASGDLAESTARGYERTLEALLEDLGADVALERIGWARLSYRRAAEIFKAASGGRTLHKMHHSRLTHLAERGEDVTLIKAKSHHRSVRSLERHVNPSNAAVAHLTDHHDPNSRARS